MKEIVTLITPSSSRPECLEVAIASLKEKLIGIDDYVKEKILHEDVFHKQSSEKVIEIAKTFYTKIKISDPKIGHAGVMNYLLKEVKTPYSLYWEDDWELIRELSLTTIINLMESHKDKINCISFNKRSIYSEAGGFKKKEIEINGFRLTTKNHWSFLPSLWRMSYVKLFIEPNAPPLNGDPAWDLNRRMKNNKNTDADWNIENIKVFYFGPIGSDALVKNLSPKSVRKGEYQWK